MHFAAGTVASRPRGLSLSGRTLAEQEAERTDGGTEAGGRCQAAGAKHLGGSMLSRGKGILFYPAYDGPPLGAPLCMLALASTLRQANFEVLLIDAAIDPDYRTHIMCESVDALCIGISVLTGPMIQGAIEIATAIKSALPWLPIIFGGWHPTLVPDETLSEPFVDIVVRGQGEVTLVEIAEALLAKRSLDGIAGVSFKTDGRRKHNVDRHVE